jgi:hypothetical protein
MEVTTGHPGDPFAIQGRRRSVASGGGVRGRTALVGEQVWSSHDARTAELGCDARGLVRYPSATRVCADVRAWATTCAARTS